MLRKQTAGRSARQLPWRSLVKGIHGEEYGASWQSWRWSNRETFRCWFRSVVPKLLTNLRPVHVNSMIPSINLIIKFVACVFVYLTVGMFLTGFSGQKVWFEKSSYAIWEKINLETLPGDFFSPRILKLSSCLLSFIRNSCPSSALQSGLYNLLFIGA